MEASSSRIRIELSKLFSSPCAPNEITSRLIDFFSACLTKCNFVTSQQQMLFWEWALQRARKSRWELWRMDGQDHTLGLGLRGIDCARALSGLKPRVAAWGRTCYQVQWQRPLMFTLTKGLTHTPHEPALSGIYVPYLPSSADLYLSYVTGLRQIKHTYA